MHLQKHALKSCSNPPWHSTVPCRRCIINSGISPEEGPQCRSLTGPRTSSKARSSQHESSLRTVACQPSTRTDRRSVPTDGSLPEIEGSGTTAGGDTLASWRLSKLGSYEV